MLIQFSNILAIQMFGIIQTMQKSRLQIQKTKLLISNFQTILQFLYYLNNQQADYQQSHYINYYLNMNQKQNHNHILSKLFWVTSVCLIFMAAQIIGGILANSIAIMADAMHLLSDVLAFAISAFSVWLASRKSPIYLSYGYHKTQTLGALINIAIIWIVTIILFVEATQRIITKQKVQKPQYMLLTSIFGLICNLIMMKILHSDQNFKHQGCSHHHGHKQNQHHNHNHNHEDHHDHQNKQHKHHQGCSHSKNQTKKNKSNHHKHKHGQKCNHSKDNVKDAQGSASDTQIQEHKENHNHDSHHEHEDQHEHHNHDHSKKHEHKSNHDNHKHQHNSQHKHDNHDHKHNHDHSKKHDHHDHKNCSHKHSDQNQDYNDRIELDLGQSNQYGKIMIQSQQDLVEQQLTILKSDKYKAEYQKNVNLQAAYIHILGDIILSIGVIISAAIIYFFTNDGEPWNYYHLADPLCTYFFSILVVFTTVKITKRSIIILLDGCADSDLIPNIKRQLKKLKQISSEYDLKVWSIKQDQHLATLKLNWTGNDKQIQKIENIFEKYNTKVVIQINS